ncbi:MFS transporter [Paracoccus aestuariivivens]|uniref:MFS transporter n=1 Tax=Paracoccus aestuariivivens TaxID=1820333 RepID=A0A6L6JHV5_9RHOB|nr:MFS transporter [Paracoccus aestuariivivens]MTH79724.1 MFS transporter [Paracoccus aestuariivivens]
MSTQMGTASAVAKRTNARWGILAMLFIATTINYADRATMSMAGKDMSEALGLSPVQMGYVLSAFAWSYVLAQLPMGTMLDKYGSRRVYFWGLLLWSLFTVMQGTVGFLTGGAAVFMLFALRLAVGAAEAPCFPGNARLTSAWFPKQERGFASAIFNSSQYFATAAFAPLMGAIIHHLGWQAVFYIIGGLGVVLAAIWGKVIYPPRLHPTVNKAELDYIREGGALVDMDYAQSEAKPAQVDTKKCVKELLASRMLLGVYSFQFCINILTYFFLTWFPIYLVKERGMSILKAGFVASMPALCGFAGAILGGYISDLLLKKGYSLTFARKAPVVVGMFLAMSMLACEYVESDALVVFFMSLSFFGKGIGSLGWAIVSDTSPKEAGGISGGLFNTFGNCAGIVTPIVIGYLVAASGGSFNSALVFVGLSAAVALFMMLFVVGKIERVELKKSLIAQPAK